jgi:hypothetical protein
MLLSPVGCCCCPAPMQATFRFEPCGLPMRDHSNLCLGCSFLECSSVDDLYNLPLDAALVCTVTACERM